MPRYIEDTSHAAIFVQGSLNSLLPATSVARTLLGVLRELNFSAFEQKYKNDVSGRPALEPRRLAAVWILGLMRGITSSVQLADYCSRDVEFRWLLGDAPVNKSTLCAFRKNSLDALKLLSTHVLAALARANQLPGKELVLDGTIVEAASSCAAVTTRKKLKQKIQKLQETVSSKLEEAEHEPQAVTQLEQKVQRLQHCLEEITQMGLLGDEERVTVTEPEASLKKLKKGGFAPAHNVQAVVDAQGGAIIHVEVVDQANDQGQLQPQTTQAAEELERVAQLTQTPAQPVTHVAADAGYHEGHQLAALHEQGLTLAVPDQLANRRTPDIDEAYASDKFVFDAAANTMVCPEGHHLKANGRNANKTSYKYRGTSATCSACPAKPKCCPKATGGRTANRPVYGEQLQAIAQHLKSKEGQRQMRARRTTSEGVFSRMKQSLHWRRCRTWGKAGAQAEALWRQIAHNLLLLTGNWQPLVVQGA